MSEDIFCTALVNSLIQGMKPPRGVQYKGKQVAVYDWAESVYESRVTVLAYLPSIRSEVVVETARCEDGGPPPSTLDGWKTRKGVLRQVWTVPQTVWAGDPARLSEAVANILRFALRETHRPVVGGEPPPPVQDESTELVKRLHTRKLNLGDR